MREYIITNIFLLYSGNNCESYHGCCWYCKFLTFCSDTTLFQARQFLWVYQKSICLSSLHLDTFVEIVPLTWKCMINFLIGQIYLSVELADSIRIQLYKNNEKDTERNFFLGAIQSHRRCIFIQNPTCLYIFSFVYFALSSFCFFKSFHSENHIKVQ